MTMGFQVNHLQHRFKLVIKFNAILAHHSLCGSLRQVHSHSHSLSIFDSTEPQIFIISYSLKLTQTQNVVLDLI